ncbi:glucosamine-6-phosphate isomerase [Staphylococcus agnetis]|uniref:6-phosphogluconolactonase n=1 Tax=Staphylococcus agnetis TaxID=985762 RepID=UPI000D03C312|nr:glucosamine-6-phosphate isomerase [Staphylococcus agnetis]MCO4339404.1 glucosamine-6-phosphate isomerase [Staphylococcus agnetis]MCO4340731.1 glucosamine-6-phosphate isomerase [Staphylococcus agnetis]MCO4344082.1 glucosamine-6-phosphate isomerase [Staphylococcus agnetis]MCO4347756.1 glucosamine-6-phosphate isomerase [Staphylococcus agnetis]MCO4350130.1 glucosamine-6-phosphate isomerase [Staphylococcus agnetis]
MAMNFKVFKDKDTVAVYAADIIRKQFNNNPTTIAGFHLSEEEAPVLDYLKRNVNDHAVDFSQIHILDYDKQASYFKALGVPEKQIHEIPEEDEVEKFIEHKAKTKDNKGKLTLQVVSINNKGEFGVPVNNGLKPAREIFVVVTGSDKADVIKKLYEDNGNTSFIPSSLKTHRMVNVILDEAAAQGLPDDVREYFTSLYA